MDAHLFFTTPLIHSLIEHMSERTLTQPFVVVAAIIERDKKILLAKQGQNNALGLWDLPAGWVDLEEDLSDAAVRETQEETGLSFVPTDLVGIYSHVKRSKVRIDAVIQPITFVFRGTWTGKLLADGKEVIEHDWFSLEQIEAMDQTVLRSLNIKTIVKDYFNRITYPLALIHHEIQA